MHKCALLENCVLFQIRAQCVMYRHVCIVRILRNVYICAFVSTMRLRMSKLGISYTCALSAHCVILKDAHCQHITYESISYVFCKHIVSHVCIVSTLCNVWICALLAHCAFIAKLHCQQSANYFSMCKVSTLRINDTNALWSHYVLIQ